MNGFFCAGSTRHTTVPHIAPSWKTSFGPTSDCLHNLYSDAGIRLERCSAVKFGSEKHFITTSEFVFINEGIIYNLDELLAEEKVSSTTELIQQYINHKEETFFKKFEGNFCGVLYQPKKHLLTIFNNQTAQKKIYYYQRDSLFACATDLKVLSKYLHELQEPLSIDERSAYQLLTSGFMLGHDTLIAEIKQVGAGEFLCFCDGNCTVQSYFNLSDISENTDSKEDMIHNLDSLFRRAIRLEFEIDKKHNLLPLTTLSGGLDSRMTALVAHKMGYDNQQLFGLSQKGYADERIAQQIASTYHLQFKAYHLSPESIIPVDEVVAVNDGQVLYSMCSHFYSIIRQIDPRSYGIIHTGLLGDAVMGSYVSNINPQMCQLTSGLYSTRLLPQAKKYILENRELYSCDEHYKFYNRGFNGINTSFEYFDWLGETSSPFLNPSFLRYAHSIPRRYKYKESLYIDWIRSVYPDLAQFIWENIGCRPTNNAFVRKAARLKRAVVKRLPIHTQWKHTMTPEQLWYDKNPKVKSLLDHYFEQHIGSFHASETLCQDMIRLYQTGNFTEKSQVLTLLGAYKLLINKK